MKVPSNEAVKQSILKFPFQFTTKSKEYLGIPQRSEKRTRVRYNCKNSKPYKYELGQT